MKKETENLKNKKTKRQKNIAATGRSYRSRNHHMNHLHLNPNHTQFSRAKARTKNV